MTRESEKAEPKSKDASEGGSGNGSSTLSASALVVLGLFPMIAMGGVLVYLLQTGGGLSALNTDRPPVQKLHVDRVVLPSANRINVHVTNDGPEPVQIAQVLVDEAYWRFDLGDAGPLKPLSSTVVRIPYMWVRGAEHEITLITGEGVTVSHVIPVALETPRTDLSTVVQFALVGLYVGIIPVLLGMLWYPLITRVPSWVYHFVLSITLGLLAYLAVSTWLEAMEFARELASFWQGVPLVVLISSFVFLGLAMIGSGAGGGAESRSLRVAYLVALGIGLHNFGEGLAIGVAYAGGEVALSTFLIVGFALHNLTEGIGIGAPVARDRPSTHHFLWLLLLGGAPAIVGTWIGGFTFQPLLGVVFLSVGVGAIAQVIWEVGKILRSEVGAEGGSFCRGGGAGCPCFGGGGPNSAGRWGGGGGGRRVACPFTPA
jgi:zinc transporter ZupT